MSINVCTETQDAIDNGPYTSGADITASIEECIAGMTSTDAADKAMYEDPYIPDGIYLISSKITFPNRAGMSLRGAGAIGETESYIAEGTSGGRGSRTVLKWDGAEDGTMFEVQGKYVHLSDLCFNGRTAAMDTASTGIHVTKGSNLATGHCVWQRLSFWNFNDYGVRFGSAVNTANCEEVDFYNVDFYDCGVAAVYAQNQFAFGLRFNGCRIVQGCPIFFWGAGGGKTVFNDCSVLTSNVTFLRTTQVTGGFGLNSSNYDINRIIIDNQASDGFKLIDGDSYNLEVTVNGGVQSILEGGEYVYTGEYVNVKGRSVIRFNGHRSNFNNMIGATQANYGTPLFIFNGCGGYQRNPREQITGDYYVRQYACFNAVTNELYTDYGGMPYAKDDIRGPRVWTWPRRPRTVKSPVIVSVHPSFDGTLAFDLTNVLSRDSGIDTITSVTVSPSGPTITGPNGESDPAKDSRNRKVLFDIDGGQADDTDYTFTCEVTTTDSDSALVVTGVMQCRD